MLTQSSVRGTAAVIGAGAMGGGIAALLAGAGWSVLLLDISSGAGKRNAIAAAGLARVKAARPPQLFAPEHAERIAIGNIEDDAGRLAEADWIVEAVSERIEVKQATMAIVGAHASANAVVTTNTSGLGLTEIAAPLPPAVRRRFLGAHFFNPPRQVTLLELIRLPDTDDDVARAFAAFAETVLGRRIVWARDTPGFISNRIGMWHLYDSIREAEDRGLSVEEVDLLTGPLIGRPRSATFGLADLIGLDVMQDIALSQRDRLPSDPFRDRLLAPRSLLALIDRGSLGHKCGAGYYRRSSTGVDVYDLERGDYRPAREPGLGDLEELDPLALPERIERLAGYAATRYGAYLTAILISLDRYVQTVGPQIAGDVVAIDRVMQWGFKWQMGPFAIGDRLAGAAGRPASYGVDETVPSHRVFGAADPRPTVRDAGEISLVDLKRRGAAVLDSAWASLVDIGDGCACLEFHTKMNTLSEPVSEFVIQAAERASTGFAALVVGNQGRHFSAGFDIRLFLERADAQDWEGIDRLIAHLQSAYLALKYASIPVVAAPFGYTLGGGCECVLHCSSAHASAELSMGLPEAKIGVLPAGGGTKELLIRFLGETAPGGDEFGAAQRAFDIVSRGAVGTSAFEAKTAGLLRASDGIEMNADRLLSGAKARALSCAAGYAPRARDTVPVAGPDGYARLAMGIHQVQRSGALSEHDALVARRIAWVLTGGDIVHRERVSEEYLLLLEREAFVALLKTHKTQERMRHTLATGKHLRN